ncbi:hypothetical protein M9H77_17336 [Catharanthus roseus]|uniref:Uncharacterized protein n=1 Tax=Catharanthus roseus TaxID=4058 RepID=A0ACC0B4D6_CATRO|nr:hypothetical protein M9H77_17336 [Catharanthus roseus]
MWMEEVQAHVHPGPIVPDVLTRQHEHRSRLIWSGDHETFVHGSFRGCTTDRGSLIHTTDLGMVVYPYITAPADPTYSGRPSCSTWCYMLRDLSSLRNEYIRLYRDITRVYIGNPANRDTRTVRYQNAGVDRRMMTFMLQEFCKESADYHSELHGFYWRYIGLHSISARYSADISSTAIASLSHEPVPDRGARGIKRGARRLPDGGAHGGRAPAPPYMGRRGHADPKHAEERGKGSGGCGRGDLGFDATYLVPSTYIVRASPCGFRVFVISVTSLFGFRILFTSRTTSSGHWEFFISCTSSFAHWEFFISGTPPPGTDSSSTPYIPISTTSSSDLDRHDDEQINMVTPAQQLGFGHRVGKKTTRFTPSD